MNSSDIETFSVLSEIPLKLHMWWHDLGKGSRDTVVKSLGGLVDLLKIRPRKDVIEALIPFWDPTRNVFRFLDFELTPTLEEIAGYAGLNGNLRGRYPLAPRPVTLRRFLDLLNISRDIQDSHLAEGCCTLHFLYHRYGNPKGFEEPNTGLTHAGNKDKWEARRGLAFMVAFLGVVICPRKDGHIDLGLVGMLDVAMKKPTSTVVPLIVAEMYRALTKCREGGKFFHGCNLLLQLWIQEHLCHRTGYMNYGLTGLSCIGEFETRVTGIEFPEGTEAWSSCLRFLTADKVEWAYGWLPPTEAVYTSAEVPYILLMGIRSIQPYDPYRVLRQFGRFQTVHNDEDLSGQVIELGPKAAFPEGRIRKIWNECRYLEPKTIVQDQARGEVDPKYLVWFGKRFQIPERPAKRQHVQQLTSEAQVQWDWLAKEKEYRARIGALEKQVQELRFENNLQAAANEGDKKQLAQENEALKAQIQQLKLDARNRERSLSDERLIRGLKKQVLDCQEELEKSEGSVAKLRTQWAKKTEERARFVQQMKKNYEGTIANMKRKMNTLEEKAARREKYLQAEREQCYGLIADMEREVKLLQDLHFQDSQVLEARTQQISRLLQEKGRIRERIRNIAKYIVMKCQAGERMGRTTFFASVMIFVRQVMNDLDQLQKGLARRPAAMPSDAPRAPGFEALMYS